MKATDLAGKKFGLLTVLYRTEDHTYQSGRRDIQYHCQCQCGGQIDVLAIHLRSGHTKSCGCLRIDKLRKNRIKHGMTNTRLYSVWRNMRARCGNVKNKNYHQYGGRGITICDEWNGSFAEFAKWALSNGYADGLTIDRIDVNGNYCPENCAWRTQKQQCNNTTRNINIEYNGCVHTMKEWSEILKINYGTLSARISRGWEPQRALEEPPHNAHAH